MHETGAFHFAIRAAVALAPAVLIGVVAGPLPALVVALTGIAAMVGWTVVTRQGRPQIRSAPRHLGPPEERRILVVANGVLGDGRVPELVEQVVAGSDARILLLAPLRVSTVRRLASDTDGAHAELERRLAETAAAISCAPVSTALADDESLQAVEDALRRFGADEILVLTRNERSELVRQTHDRFAVPLSHVVLGEVEAAVASRDVTQTAV